MNAPPPAHRPPTKRRRAAHSTEDDAPRSPLFVNLPFELVAEILLYTRSTKDILATARTCRFLCNTLLRKESESIWKYARAHILPAPLPDPKDAGLSEAAFAAMLFDYGPCANCGRNSQNMLSSFSLRIRFCSRPECPQAWSPTNVTHVANIATLPQNQRAALEWLPLAESSACFWFPSVWPYRHAQVWPLDKIYLNRDMQTVLSEYAIYTADKVRQRHALEKERQQARMKFYAKVYEWKRARSHLTDHVQKSNEAFGKKIAIENGYEYLELIQGANSYNQLRLQKTKALDLLVQADFNAIAGLVELEMIAYKNREERRLREAGIREQRSQVETHYQRLLTKARAQVPPLAMPALPEFRTMPVLKLLQGPSVKPTRARTSKEKAPTVGSNLKERDSLLSQMLNQELDQWRKDAERNLGAVLGFPVDWKTAKSNILPPAKRLTARWTCGRCQKVERSYKWDECMDFQGVCRHECPGTRESTRHPRRESTWKAENFVKDEQAVNAVEKLLTAANINVESPEAAEKLNVVGARVLCLSCPGAIVMFPHNVIGHSHRHENMELEVLDGAEANRILAVPVEKDLAKHLLGGTDDKRVKQAKKTWLFGCRHCEQERVAPAPPSVNTNDDEESEVAAQLAVVRGPKFPKKKARRFALNGIRSHLKESHKIELPSDEDFYHVLGARPQQENSTLLD
uniref:F-box domain-containing protein n=1 Tax=Mycena chlorophos TaxID=658473 RepID=A0ABQ0MAP7_MYCCL|nr:predicted protein [Mycena chlorophos]